MPNRFHALLWLLIPAVFYTQPLLADNTQTIALEFEYGNGFSKHFKSIGISQGDTVLDAMKTMQKHPHKILFKSRGNGEFVFIYEIDLIKNQGNGKNWMFYVNGRRAKVGVGAYKLKANDHVVWKYEVFQ